MRAWSVFCDLRSKRHSPSPENTWQLLVKAILYVTDSSGLSLPYRHGLTSGRGKFCLCLLSATGRSPNQGCTCFLILWTGRRISWIQAHETTQSAIRFNVTYTRYINFNRRGWLYMYAGEWCKTCVRGKEWSLSSGLGLLVPMPLVSLCIAESYLSHMSTWASVPVFEILEWPKGESILFTM